MKNYWLIMNAAAEKGKVVGNLLDVARLSRALVALPEDPG